MLPLRLQGKPLSSMPFQVMRSPDLSCVSCVGAFMSTFFNLTHLSLFHFFLFFSSYSLASLMFTTHILLYISTKYIASIISRYDQSMLSRHALPSSTFQYLFIRKMRRRGRDRVCVCVCMWKRRTLIMNRISVCIYTSPIF